MFSNQLLLLYFVPVCAMLLFLLTAFLRDETTPNNDRTSWMVVAIGALLWPITLPSVVSRRISRRRNRSKGDASFWTLSWFYIPFVGR